MKHKLARIVHLSAEYFYKFDRDPLSMIDRKLKDLGFIQSSHQKYRFSISTSENSPVALITVKINPGKQVAYINHSLIAVVSGERRTKELDQKLNVPFSEVEKTVVDILDSITSFYEGELNV